MSAWIPEDQKKNGDLLVPKAGAIGGVLEDANCDCNPNRANSDLAKCSWAKSSKSDCDLMDQQFCCDGTFDNKGKSNFTKLTLRTIEWKIKIR